MARRLWAAGKQTSARGQDLGYSGQELSSPEEGKKYREEPKQRTRTLLRDLSQRKKRSV